MMTRSIWMINIYVAYPSDIQIFIWLVHLLPHFLKNIDVTSIKEFVKTKPNIAVVILVIKGIFN